MIQDSPTPAPFRDRSRGLTFYGAALAAVGIIGVGATAAMPFTNAGTPVRFLFGISAFRTYATGIALAWLGIGSLLKSRWSAALLFCLGLIHFVYGVLTVPAALIVMFAGPGGKAEWASLLGQFLRIGLPAALIGYYSQPDVRRTCEARHPKQAWTDACPLPVLACFVLLAERALEWLGDAVFNRLLPFAGELVAGPSGRWLWLALALVTVYAALGILRFDRRIWAGYSVVYAGFCLSAVFTFLRMRQAQGDSPEAGAAIWAWTANLLLGIGLLVSARFVFPADRGNPDSRSER
jgi:hypothetical protein